MTDLQIALIAIGALIIIAVLIINWWQERRFHRQLDSNFSPLKNDALLDEPSLESSELQSAIDHHDSDRFSINSEVFEDSISEPSIQSYTEEILTEDVAHQPVSSDLPMQYDGELTGTHADAESAVDAEPSEGPRELDVLPEHAATLPAMLQGQMDLTALLYLATATSVDAINNALGLLFKSFDKPVFIHVLDANKQWHLLEELTSNSEALNRQISKVACSIQLADRGGAISRSTLNHFQLTVENFSLAINGHVEWQGKGDAFANAIALDEFCIEVDKTIGFHLAHGENGAFTGTKLKGLAEAQGLKLGADGYFKCIDEADVPQTNPLFVMFNRDDYPFSPDMLRTSVVKGITFQLDIPHVKKCTEAFNHMVQLAQQMEVSLNAVLVDDNNKVLGDVQIEKIRQQLKVIQANMLLRGIVPGSDSARRLFS